MKVICMACGTAYDDSESSHVSEYHAEVDASEHFAACPHCGCTEAAEAEWCKECGEWFMPEMVENERCIHCLKKKLTAASFYSFAICSVGFGNQASHYEDFIFSEFFNMDSYPGETISSEFRGYLVDLCVNFIKQGDFRNKLYHFMDKNDLWYDFSEWLDETEKSHD